MEQGIFFTFLMEHGIREKDCRNAERVLNELDLLDKVREIQALEKGMTNRLFLLETEQKKLLLRIPGEGTEQIINRYHEADAYHVLQHSGLTEPVIYINPENGIKVSEYIEDAVTCDCKNEAEVGNCMEVLRRFHKMERKVPHVFDVFAELRLYEEQCGICIGNFEDCLVTRKHVMELRNLIEQISKEMCFCHVDPVCDNFLLKSERIYLIDWEYAAMSDPFIDIAMFCIYAGYDKTQTDRTIEAYLGEAADVEIRMLVYAYMSACSYLWVLWSEIKRMEGVDYWEYEQMQYQLSKDYYQYAMELYRKNKNLLNVS